VLGRGGKPGQCWQSTKIEDLIFAPFSLLSYTWIYQMQKLGG
jgi:hypothetical protein